MDPHRRNLLIILLVALGLRIYLVLAGGQFFWPDEERYFIARSAANELLDGDLWGTFYFLHSAEHFLFKVIAVAPAVLEKLFGENDSIPALFFSIFSVLNLWLVGRIARALGANERESLLATLLLGLASTYFYYTRHLLPYDMAMSFGLGAIWMAVRRPVRTSDSILCGLLALAALLTYNGYWVMASFGLLAHFALRASAGRKRQLVLSTLSVAAFAAPTALLLVVSNIFAPKPLDEQFLSFTETIIQGDFSEGWSLPFEYLWHAEHLLLVFWIGAAAVSAWLLWEGERNSRILLGLSGILFSYTSLVFVSMVLEKFVVYGRLARQLVPFLCILGAFALERMWASGKRGRRASLILITVLAIQTGFNFYTPLVQKFPTSFREEVRHIRKDLEPGEFIFVNVHFIHPDTLAEAPQDRPRRTVLIRPHPLEYLPYQYEGYTPEKREYLRSTDIRMKFVVYEGE